MDTHLKQVLPNEPPRTFDDGFAQGFSSAKEIILAELRKLRDVADATWERPAQAVAACCGAVRHLPTEKLDALVEAVPAVEPAMDYLDEKG